MYAFLNCFFRICFVFLLTLWLTGCRKEVIDPSLLGAQAKLTVFSFIAPQDTLLTVRVRQSQPFFQAKAQPGSAVTETDATVLISDGTTSVVLAHDREGIYTASADKLPVLPGRTYFLTVTTPGGLGAKATCTVPLRANNAITQTQLEPATSGQFEGYFLSVEWQDAPGEGDYYRIFAEPPVMTYRLPGNDGQTEQTDTVYLPAIVFQQGETYIQDTGQDGQFFRVAKGGFTTNILTSGRNNVQFERKIKVILLTTDRAYYQYHQSLQRYQEAKPTNPFVEPSFVFSNIEGGLGVFAAYQKYEQEVRF